MTIPTRPGEFGATATRALLSILIAALAACSSGTSGDTAAIQLRAVPRVERVVLITIDTLRADHLGSYGYLLDTTPFLDSLAESGVRFSRALAHTGTTQPSHSSLFTSLYPIQHNVLKNGHSLAPEFLTLAEMLSVGGMKTAATTSTNAHFEWGGLAQGFDYYNELERSTAPNPELYRRANRTVDAAVKWLDTEDASGRFFLWVHLFDPHRPFRPPAEHALRIRRGQQVRPDQLTEFLAREQRLEADAGLLELIYDYDAEISFADAELRRLFEELQSRDMIDGTLWVVTGDHGQGLNNHGWFGHSKQIYNEQLRVPLIFWMSAGLPQGMVVDRMVEHVDVAPTIAELTGTSELLLAQPAEIQGQSLWGLMSGVPASYTKRYAFAQRAYYPTDDDGSAAIPGDNYALQDDRYKFHYYPDADGADEFYDLSEDPYETLNLIDSEGELAGLFRGRLVEMMERLRNAQAPTEVDAETVERLRALGYIQ